MILVSGLVQFSCTNNNVGSQSDNDPDPPNIILILADGTQHNHKGGVVAASQSIDQETGTYTVEAAFPNPRKLLLPGQFARVRAMYQVLDDVVVIPRQAVSEMQGLFRVYLVDGNGVVEVRNVTLGPETGYDVVIEEGLESGETIIVEGLQKVRPESSLIASCSRSAGLALMALHHRKSHCQQGVNSQL